MIIAQDKIVLKDCIVHVIGCTVMGKGKIENQDSVEIRQVENGLIIAVADGLGSAAYSKEGSEKAVKITADILSENNLENFAERLLSLWKNGLQGNINQYDTTIKFIYVKASKIMVGGIGDGWIALKNQNGLESCVAASEFSNQTDSILSTNLKDKFWVKEFNVNDVSSMVIATDGFSEDIDKENGFQFLSQVENEMREKNKAFAYELDNTLRNWPVETNKDDKTVVFVVLTKENIHE